MKLRGKLAVVTGATGGIGRAVALDLAKQGVRLALLARDAEKLEEVRTVVTSLGVPAIAVPTDVTNADSVAAALRTIEARLGAPDILVNAAGFAVWKPFAEITDEQHRRMMDVNYWGTWHCIRAVLDGMRARRRGAIVNIAGGGGKFAMPVTSGYSASKFAVVGLSEALYREHRSRGIQVSCLCPGSVATGFWNEELVPRAGLPALVRFSPKLSAAAVARSVRLCLWFGIPVWTTPVFVSFLAKINALWLRLGDLLLWKWFFPGLAGWFLLRFLLLRLAV